MIPLIVSQRHRLRHQPRDRLRHLRRPVAGAAADAARHAGRLLAVRRRVEGAAVRPRADAVAEPVDQPGCRHDRRPPISVRPRRCDRLIAGIIMRTTAASCLARRPPLRADGSGRRRRRRRSALTVDEAVKMALEHNVDLAADRLDPQISDTRVAAAAGAFRPTINTSVQREQPAAAAVELPDSDADAHRRRHARTPASASGCRGSARPTTSAWTTTHTNSNSFLNSYNPLLQSGLSVNVSQPLAARSVHRRRRGSSSRSAGPTATSPTRACARASCTRRRA